MSAPPQGTDPDSSSLEAAGWPAVTLDDACDRAVDTNWETIGTVNTIVVPPAAEVIEVTIVAVPATACPRGSFAAQLVVTNRGDSEVEFAPHRGLILQSGGMTNWEIAPVARTKLPAGATFVIDLTATLPNVAPGHYRLAAEGFRQSVEFEVVEPTGRISSASAITRQSHCNRIVGMVSEFLRHGGPCGRG